MKNPASIELSPALSDDSWVSAFSSRYFPEWLEQQRCSLGFTTYQTGKLFLIGRKADTRSENPLSIFERNVSHCMGMCASIDSRTLWLSSRYQISECVNDFETAAERM